MGVPRHGTGCRIYRKSMPSKSRSDISCSGPLAIRRIRINLRTIDNCAFYAERGQLQTVHERRKSANSLTRAHTNRVRLGVRWLQVVPIAVLKSTRADASNRAFRPG